MALIQRSASPGRHATDATPLRASWTATTLPGAAVACDSRTELTDRADESSGPRTGAGGADVRVEAAGALSVHSDSGGSSGAQTPGAGGRGERDIRAFGQRSHRPGRIALLAGLLGLCVWRAYMLCSMDAADAAKQFGWDPMGTLVFAVYVAYGTSVFTTACIARISADVVYIRLSELGGGPGACWMVAQYLLLLVPLNVLNALYASGGALSEPGLNTSLRVVDYVLAAPLVVWGAWFRRQAGQLYRRPGHTDLTVRDYCGMLMHVLGCYSCASALRLSGGGAGGGATGPERRGGRRIRDRAALDAFRDESQYAFVAFNLIGAVNALGTLPFLVRGPGSRSSSGSSDPPDALFFWLDVTTFAWFLWLWLLTLIAVGSLHSRARPARAAHGTGAFYIFGFAITPPGIYKAAGTLTALAWLAITLTRAAAGGPGGK